jgi:hypothetical protein
MKEAATVIWTAHDGKFQITIAVHGGGVVTYEMTPEAFYRQFGRQGELVASKMSGVGRPDRQCLSLKSGGVVSDCDGLVGYRGSDGCGLARKAPWAL